MSGHHFYDVASTDRDTIISMNTVYYTMQYCIQFWIRGLHFIEYIEKVIIHSLRKLGLRGFDETDKETDLNFP